MAITNPFVTGLVTGRLGNNSDTTYTDEFGKVWTGAGGCVLTNSSPQYPPLSLSIPNTTSTTDWALANADNAGYVLGAGDFCVDVWVQPAINTEFIIIDNDGQNGTAGWRLGVYGGPTTTKFYWYSDIGGFWEFSIGTVNAGQNYHGRAQRIGTTLQLWWNGTYLGQNTDATNYNRQATNTLLGRGANNLSFRPYQGLIGGVQVMVGANRGNASANLPSIPSPYDFLGFSGGGPVNRGPRFAGTPTVSRLLGYVAPASGTDTPVNPGIGSLVITGYAPTIAQPQTSNPGVGALTLTGFAPTIAQPQTAAPGVGSLTLTGYAPSIVQGQNVNPSAGTITITGYAPDIAQPQSAAPGVGTIAITGYAPSIAQPLAVAPGAGSISFTGYSPSVAQTANQAVLPGAGAVAFTGYAPSLAQTANQTVTAGAGTGVLTGYAPTVTQASASNSAAPDAGVLTITGYAPSVVQGGGIDSWGSVYVREKKKKKEPESIQVAGPAVREFIEAAMSAHEPPEAKTAGRAPAVVNDDDEEESLMLLL